MKVCLDTCSLQRPLDSRTQIRIGLEAEAIMGIINLCEDGTLELVSSDVLLFESKRNPWAERRAYALAVLDKAEVFVQVNEDIRQRANELQRQGLKPLDALHLASAEAGEVDYFCTTDDRLLARGKALTHTGIRVVSPTELIQEINR